LNNFRILYADGNLKFATARRGQYYLLFNYLQNPHQDFNVFRYYRSICPETERGTERNEKRQNPDAKFYIY
jgi:hypothetical protein